MRVDQLAHAIDRGLSPTKRQREDATPKIGRLRLDGFADDETSAFELEIEWLAEQGITHGCNPPTNDRYYPDTR